VTSPGVDIKLRRAEAHATDLDLQVNALFGRDRYAIRRDFDGGDRTKYVYWVEGLAEVPPEWSAIFGDAMHNARSALDHLAGDLVRASNKQATCKTQFPIRYGPPKEKGQIVPVDIRPGVRSDIRRELTELQPYSTDNPAQIKGPAEAKRHPLWILHDLDIIDKHRELLLMTRGVDLTGLWWGRDSSTPQPGYWFNPGPLKDGDEVARFDFRGTEAPDDFNPNIEIAVVLNEGPAMFRINGLPQNASFLGALAYSTIERLKPFL
jgi:hypothetical protein